MYILQLLLSSTSKMVSMDFFCNPMSLVFAISALTLVFLMKILVGKSTEKKRYHPIGGTVFNQLFNFNRLHHYMTDLAGKHRTYRLLSPLGMRFTLLTQLMSSIYSRQTSRIMASHWGSSTMINFRVYPLNPKFGGFGSYNYNILRDLLGDGIFTVDDEKWRQQRKVSSYEFSTKDLFMKATLDSIFKVAFGVELDSMCGSNEEGTKFGSAFDDASAMTLYRYVDIFWTIKKSLNIGSEATLKRSIKVVDDFVYKLIHSKTELMKNSQNDSSMKKDDILSRHDSNCSFLVHLHALQASTIQEKVAQEVREAINLKEATNYAEFAASVTEEALEKMQYLHAAITETLRLYPAVPVDAKICFSDDTLPDGFSVRKGDMVSYQPYAMGRMRFVWGDDAEEFRPERWLNEKGLFCPESLSNSLHFRTMINLHIDGGLHVRAFHRPDTKILEA
ncbi:Cytochrome P450 704C1 [Vitis vinifera]|uniref:Cytochrome P450 704C1 n=1 Tax=Vitis vinifera TaxID=29760 RepID=A0A438IWD5_VITVI|nr:Cytochrome P450 704C1 [Vitis vinifera]